MRRRILLAILSISALAIALFALPLVFVTERFVDENATLRLERQAILAARSVPDDYRASNDAVGLVGSGSTHLALYDPGGHASAGSAPVRPTRRRWPRCATAWVTPRASGRGSSRCRSP